MVGDLLFVLLLLLRQFASLGFIFQFFIGLIGRVCLIEAVSGVAHDHIQKSFEHFSFEIPFEVLSVNFMRPKRHENSIHILPIFKLLVELMARSCDCDITIKFHQHIGQISMADGVGLKYIRHYSNFTL